MIKACIFDLDGTLTNTLDSLEYSVNETMKEIGMPQITKGTVPAVRWRWGEGSA